MTSQLALNFTEMCSQKSNWQWTSICLGNGLSPNRRQAITWTSADPVHWRIYAALGGGGGGGDELALWWQIFGSPICVTCTLRLVWYCSWCSISFRMYVRICVIIYQWISRCVYQVIRLCRHQRMTSHSTLFITSTGSVAHDAAWSVTRLCQHMHLNLC